MTAKTTNPRVPEDTFQARLMLARLHAGNLTIREAASRCGLTNESWSNWERGMRPRDVLDVAERVSRELGVDRDWLLWGGPLSGGGADRATNERCADIAHSVPRSEPSGGGARAIPSPRTRRPALVGAGVADGAA